MGAVSTAMVPCCIGIEGGLDQALAGASLGRPYGQTPAKCNFLGALPDVGGASGRQTPRPCPPWLVYRAGSTTSRSHSTVCATPSCKAICACHPSRRLAFSTLGQRRTTS